MDHLPHPANPYNPIQVPYLNGPSYDNLGFAEFPERVGWRLDRLHLRGAFGTYDPDEGAGFFQEWPWFGMLSECMGACGIQVKREDFLREEGGEKTVTFIIIINLYAYVEKFRDVATQYDEMAQIKAREKVDSCLVLVDKYLVVSYVIGTEEPMYYKQDAYLPLGSDRVEVLYKNPLTSEIQLSVEMLKGTLKKCALKYLRTVGPMMNEGGNCEFLVQRAFDRGWCLSIALGIRKNYGNGVLYYACLLGTVPAMGRDHDKCQGGCTASDIKDGSGYKRLHMCELEDCRDFEPDQEEMNAIIDTGGVPLVYILLEATDVDPVYYLLAGVCNR